MRESLLRLLPCRAPPKSKISHSQPPDARSNLSKIPTVHTDAVDQVERKASFLSTLEKSSASRTVQQEQPTSSILADTPTSTFNALPEQLEILGSGSCVIEVNSTHSSSIVSEANDEAFPYEPIEHEGHFRLLSVQRTSSRFTYEIITTTLATAPEYEAVSYVWGDNARTNVLELKDNKHVWITASLSSAIHGLSSICTTGYLWIDQLCIAQFSIEERNHQVQIMGEIYKKCTRVLIILHSELPWLPTTLTATVLNQDFENEVQANIQITWESTTPAAKRWQSIVQLCDDPWFRRAWVVQEAVLPTSAMFVIGHKLVSFENLFHFAYTVSELEKRHLWSFRRNYCLNGSDGFFKFHQIAFMRTCRLNGQRENDFAGLISRLASTSQSSDPRDLIYAFIGLQEAYVIKPNYLQPSQDVFRNVAITILSQTKSLDLLGLLRGFELDGVHAKANDGSGLSSWTPAWREPESCLPIVPTHMRSRFSACAGRAFQYISPGRSHHLVVRGKRIDRVEFYGSKFQATFHWQIREVKNFFQLEVRRLEFEAHMSPAAERIPLIRLLNAAIAEGAAGDEDTTSSKPLSSADFNSLLQAYDDGSSRHPSLPMLRFYSRICQGNRCMILSEFGKFGLASDGVRKKDWICILHGSKAPTILRPLADGAFLVIGQCYLEKCMHGEAVTWNEEDADEFILV